MMFVQNQDVIFFIKTGLSCQKVRGWIFTLKSLKILFAIILTHQKQYMW